MQFNNKFNSDNTIHFDVEEWVCTDPDEGQFCRKANDTTFEYIQLKTEELKSFLHAFMLGGKNLLITLNNRTFITDWYQDEINVEDYDADQIGSYVSAYGGEEFLGGSKGAERNQLVAECIFETDIMNGEYD